jgi:hypothetical protein
MNNCTDCGTALKPLFGSKWYCPNDCDKKPKVTNTIGECPKRWWTTYPTQFHGSRGTRLRPFYVLDDPSKSASPSLKTHEIQFIGEYDFTEGPKGMIHIHPSSKGVVIKPIVATFGNKSTINMRSFNDRATDLAQKVIAGTEPTYVLRNMLSTHVKSVELNSYNKMTIKLKHGSNLIDIPTGVVRMATTIIAPSSNGAYMIFLK